MIRYKALHPLQDGSPKSEVRKAVSDPRKINPESGCARATVLLMNGSASIRWDVSALAGPSDPGTGLGALSPKSQRCVTLPVAPTLRLYLSAGGPLHATTFPFRPADSPGWISSIGDIVLDPMDAPSPWPVCTS